MPHLALPDGDRLHYDVHGSGPPLLLVSGLGGIADFWATHIAPLTERFTVITHDHRGTGRSSLPHFDYSVEQMAGDVLALMDGLGIDRADLVGHSTGGAIGQVIAIDRPERLNRLVISASWPGHDAYFDMLFDMRAKVLKTLGPEDYLRTSALFMKTPGWLAANPQDMQPPPAEMRALMMADPDCTLRRIAAIRAFDRRADLHRITTPTLVTGAENDMVTPVHLSHELARLIPGAGLDIVADAGHFYPQTHRDQFLAQLDRFLAAG